MKPILFIGGTVISRNDGQRYYVGPHELAKLYGVKPPYAAAANDDDLPLLGVNTNDYRVLRPDPTGKYELSVILHE